MSTIPIVDDRFELHSIAGRGGMGVVYRASDRATGRHVAVKVLQASDAEACERFLREALVLATMAHPGIVRHVAHGYTASGEPYLAMEWLTGEDLSERLDRGRLAIDETVHLGADIAESLAYAHRQGVVHRDLKPANVFLIDRSLHDVRLLDFGIAHLQSGESGATRTGTVIGTPAYMAPEQARGERRLDGRADLFSLGCVLYECLTGRAPFVAASAMAVLIKVLLEEPPPLAELRRDAPPGLVRLIERLLAKDPADRPASADLTRTALTDVVLLQAPADAPAQVAALTQSERRVVTLLVVANPWPKSAEAEPAEMATRRDLVPADAPTTVLDRPADADDDGATLQVVPMGPLLQLQRRLGAIGLRLHRLLDGTLLALASSRATPAEQAALAAEGALLLRERIPRLTAVIATGYGTSNAQDGGEVAIGAAIEAAADALRDLVAANTGLVALDDNTVSLLGDRFAIDAEQGLAPPFAWRLGRAQQAVRAKNLVLGKPTPLAGRGRELAIFRALFDCLGRDGGTKVLVTGDPGYGKSRLLEEFAQWVEQSHRDAQVWRLRSEAGAQDSPYASLGSLLIQTAGLQAGMGDAERTQRVRVRVARLVPADQREAVMDLARATLGIDPGGASQRLRAAREDS
ncbi:MAG: protein kinase, partial [Deltaproteobacteria bacterium]|nr:protein kinase [Deltaproteobacteria bacterium]